MQKIPVFILFIASTFSIYSQQSKMAVLVFPLENLSGKKFSHLGAGFTDTIITDLSRIRGLVVISGEDRKKSLKEIELAQTGVLSNEQMLRVGNLTGANVLFTGSYQIQGQAIRVNARLFSTTSGTIERAVKMNGRIDDLFGLQDQIVAQLMSDIQQVNVAEVKKVEITDADKKALENSYKPKTAAYEWFAKGLEIMDTEPLKAVTFFDKAHKLDKLYAEPLIEASYVLNTLYNKTDSAEKYLLKAEKALTARNETSSQIFARLLRRMGSIQSHKKNWEKHLEYTTRSKELLEQIGAQESSDYAAVINNLTIYFENARDYQKAADLQKFAIEIRKKIGQQNTSFMAINLSNLGNFQQNMKQYPEAEISFQEAQRILQNLGLEFSDSYATVMQNYASLLRERNDFQKATELYTWELQIREKLRQQKLERFEYIFWDLGVISEKQENYGKAISFYQKSLKEKEKKGRGKTHDAAILSYLIGWNHNYLKEPQKALPYFAKSVRILQKNKETASADFADALAGQAETQSRLKRYAKCAENHFRARDIYASLDNSEEASRNERWGNECKAKQ